jgi:hypothetical protein
MSVPAALAVYYTSHEDDEKPQDPEDMRVRIAEATIAAMCAAQFYDADDTDAAAQPLITLLGGRDYLTAVWTWREACRAWRNKRKNRGPRPPAPALPVAKTPSRAKAAPACVSVDPLA